MKRFVTVVTAAVLVSASAGDAQVIGAIDLAGGIGRPLARPFVRETRVVPQLQFLHAHGFVTAAGTLTEHTGTVRLSGAHVAAAALSPTAGPLRVSLTGRMAQQTAPVDDAGDPTAVAALSGRFGAQGLWLGSEARRGARPALVAGAWRSLGRLVVSLQSTQHNTTYGVMRMNRVRSFPDSQIVTDTGVIVVPRYGQDTVYRADRGRWSDLEARVDWGAGRWSLTASLGGRPGRDSVPRQLWGRMHAAVQLSPRLAMMMSAGSLPLAPGLRGVAPARFASLGVRFSPTEIVREPLPAPVRPSPAAFVATPLPDGMTRIALHLASARVVEVAGDFNGWTPVAMRETSANLWEVTLPLARGTHRMSIRADGERWSAPPGVPTVEDEFNGRVGLIVIR